MATERLWPPSTGTEREMLRGFLDFHRSTLAWKCDGLTGEQLRTRSVAPSALTLLGLVRHMAEVERQWFRRVVNGESLPHLWSDTHDFQRAYDPAGATRAQAFTAWEAEVEHSRRIEAAAGSLDLVVHAERAGEDVSLRMIMLHLIHEYARHSGHADLLREAIDGSVGA